MVGALDSLLGRGPRSTACLEGSPKESSWSPRNRGPENAVTVGLGAGQPLSSCRLGVASLGPGMVCLAAWPGHAGAMAPAWPCTESHPSGLACQPVWLSAHPPACPCLSVCQPTRLCDSAACQQGSACPALRFVASCVAGKAMDESASAGGASPEPSPGQAAAPGAENTFLCREALRALPSQAGGRRISRMYR